MDLSIIIVNWRVKNLLYKCLQSIYTHLAGLNFEVIVIDNVSFDGSAEMVSKKFPQVNLIVNKKNAGFAHANNQGIKAAQGEYILILNPDTEFIDNSILDLIKKMDKHQEWGIVGPKILNPDKSPQPSVRRFPDWQTQSLIMLKLHHLPWFKKYLNNYLATNFDYTKQSEVDQIMGAYMFGKKSVLKQLNYFDDKFHLWFEEVDLCQRLKNNSYKIIYYPDAQIIHHGGQSFAQLNWHKQIIWNHSVCRYFWKHKPKWQWLILWLLQPISVLFAIIVHFWKK